MAKQKTCALPKGHKLAIQLQLMNGMQEDRPSVAKLPILSRESRYLGVFTEKLFIYKCSNF